MKISMELFQKLKIYLSYYLEISLLRISKKMKTLNSKRYMHPHSIPLEWGGRSEEGTGWGTHVYLWRIHFDMWQN